MVHSSRIQSKSQGSLGVRSFRQLSHHMLCQEVGDGRSSWRKRECTAWFTVYTDQDRSTQPGAAITPHLACSGYALRHTKAALPDDSRSYILTILAVTVVL